MSESDRRLPVDALDLDRQKAADQIEIAVVLSDIPKELGSLWIPD